MREDLWSEEELNILKELYPAYGGRGAAAALNRSYDSVRTKAKRLKIRRVKVTKWSVFDGKFLKKEKKVWSKEDTDYLIKFYSDYGTAAMAEDLGLPYRTVRNKAKALKLRRKQLPNRWSKEDIEFLKKFYPEKGAPYVAKELKKPVLCIRNKARRLKLKGYKPYKWSDEQIDLLMKYYPKYSADKVAKKLGRDYDSVINKASALGIVNFHKWTDHEVRFLKNNFGMKPVQTICKVLGRSRKSVTDKAYKMQLYDIKEQKWSDEHIAYLIEFFNDRSISVSEIAAVVGRSECSVTSMASNLGLNRYKKIDAAGKSYISENYKKLTYKDMAKHLGLGADAVQRFCDKNGFARLPIKNWKPEENEFLINNYHNMTNQELANHIGRPLGSVNQQAHRLGLKKFHK